MNIDELRSVQNREREAASLQNLRPTFYEDAGSFIADLEAERDRAAERADDPFASPEVRRLTDDIETAKDTVEAIYERRVGKVVKMASIAAAEMPTEEENLTNEERELFEELVGRITANREHVLGEVLEGDGPGISCSRDSPEEAESAEGAAGATAADRPSAEPSSDPADRSTPTLDRPSGEPAEPEAGTGAPADSFMGGEPTDAGGDRSADGRTDGRPVPPDEGTGPGGDSAADTDTGAEPVPAGDATGPAREEPAAATATGEDPDAGTDGAAAVDRSLVRITSDVGEIFGVDDRAYELSADEVVTLPEANADPLVERGAAERLE